MEIIKKSINLETYKNHTLSFFPSIRVYNDGKWHNKSVDTVVIPNSVNPSSWGNVLCDMPELSGSTADLLNKYYRINKILDTGIKMKRVENVNKVFYVESFDDLVKSYNYDVSTIENLIAIKPGIYELVTGDTDGDFVIFLSNELYEEYNKLGGADFISYVEGNILGLIKVEFGPGSACSGDIVGDFVPEKMYISSIPKWLKWFSDNIPGEDDDCNCRESEWVKHGGDKMLCFLEENSTLLTKFRTKPRVTIPSLNIPVFLSQSYDDNGVMSVYDETPYYKSQDTGRTEFDDNYNEPYTPESGHTINTESKLQTLRSNIKMFDDNGDLLPYIDTGITGDTKYGYLPYRENEAFNVSYDNESGEYVADYIKSIKIEGCDNQVPKDNDKNPLPVGYTTTIEFEYAIGDAYEADCDILIKSLIDGNTVSSQGSKTYYGAVAITAETDWCVLSNCSLFELRDGDSVVTGGSATIQTYDLFVKEENTSFDKDKLLNIVVSTKGRRHDEVMCAITQQHSTPPSVCSFDGRLPQTINITGNTAQTYVLCNGSDWYLKSKPDFLTVQPINGKDGDRVSVLLTCSELDNPQQIREGELVFIATDNSKITYKPLVMQGTNFPISLTAWVDGGATIGRGSYGYIQGTVKYSDGSRPVTFNDDWDYRVLDEMYANNVSLKIITSENATPQTDEETHIGQIKVTNRNTTSAPITLSIEIYNKNTPSLSTIVTIKLMGVMNLSISPSQSQQSLEAWSYVTYTVTLVGDTYYNWEPQITGSEDAIGSVTVEKTSDTTFKITNNNDTGKLQSLCVSARHIYESLESNKVTLSIKPEPTTTIKCCIVQENYTCNVDIDIWACCKGEDVDRTDEDIVANFTCGEGGCPTESDASQSWEEWQNPIIKDKNNKYYVRFNKVEGCSGNKGYVDVYNLDGELKYSIPGTMKYFIIDEYDLSDFIKGNVIFIKFLIRGIR